MEVTFRALSPFSGGSDVAPLPTSLMTFLPIPHCPAFPIFLFSTRTTITAFHLHGQSHLWPCRHLLGLQQMSLHMIDSVGFDSIKRSLGPWARHRHCGDLLDCYQGGHSHRASFGSSNHYAVKTVTRRVFMVACAASIACRRTMLIEFTSWSLLAPRRYFRFRFLFLSFSTLG